MYNICRDVNYYYQMEICMENYMQNKHINKDRTMIETLTRVNPFNSLEFNSFGRSNISNPLQGLLEVKRLYLKLSSKWDWYSTDSVSPFWVDLVSSGINKREMYISKQFL